MARRGAILSAARRPSPGRRRLQWGPARIGRGERRVGSTPGEEGGGALPRGKEGREGGRTRRRDNTRRRPHKGRGRGEMEQGGCGVRVRDCVRALLPFSLGALALDSAARRSLLLFSSRRGDFNLIGFYLWTFLSGLSLPGWRGSLDSSAPLHLYRSCTAALSSPPQVGSENASLRVFIIQAVQMRVF